MASEDQKDAKEKTVCRLQELLALQKKVEKEFGDSGYNVFVFGSYPTLSYREGKSDIDIAIYSDDFCVYRRLSAYLEEYFHLKGVDSDIFYIDTTMEAPIYCAPLSSKIQFTDYFPPQLLEFGEKCLKKLEENRARLIT